MKKMRAFVLTMFLCLLAVPVIAQVASPSPAAIVAPVSADSAISMIGTVLSLVHNGGYLAAAGVLTLIICWALNVYVLPKLSLGPALVPILSSVIGALSGLGLALANGANLQQATLALMAGPLATHLYEGAAQYVLPAASAVSAVESAVSAVKKI